jgi:hypothetical protein
VTFRRLDEFSRFPVVSPVGLKRTWVYALQDQRDVTIRYIGVSVSPERRLSFHISNPCNENLRHWIHTLKSGGHPMPVVIKLAEACDETWEKAEKSWIAFFRNAGELYNIHEGGKQKGGGGKPLFFGKGHKFKAPVLPETKKKRRRRKKLRLSMSDESQWYRAKAEAPSKSKRDEGNAAWRVERRKMLARIASARRAGT